MHLSFQHHKKVYSNRERDSFRHKLFDNPYLDWLFIILISTLLVVVCVAVGTLRYVGVQERLNTPAEANVTHTIIFDVNALTRTLKQIDERAAERATVLKGYSGVADPSL